MIYRTWEEINRIEDGKRVWACAYERDGEFLKRHSKPVYGIMDSYRHQFCQLTKKGTPSSRHVHFYSRYYADTEAECKELYNNLIEESIQKYEKCIEECRKDILI